MTGHILIVDDQPGIRLLLSDILIEEGYEVTVASTGQEAIEKLKTKTFHLLIIDYKLPVFDGTEVLIQAEDSGLSIPTILMSGLVEKLEKEIQNFPQVKRLLAKPFDIMEIKELVKKYIKI